MRKNVWAFGYSLPTAHKTKRFSFARVVVFAIMPHKTKAINTLYLSPFLAIFKARAGLKNFLKHPPCVTFLMALQRTRH